MFRYRLQTMLAWVSCAVALAFAGSAPAAQEEFSSANRQQGRAAVEYRDADIHIVAAYYHSQRNHDSRWLMIEAAMSTTGDTVIKRGDILLRTPDGREIPLATQERVGEDVVQIQRLLQNASTVKHDVVAYFNQRDRAEPMQLFTLPFGDVVHDEFVTDRNHVAVGHLFFESPRGLWDDGTYALVVRHEKGVARLPIRLE